MSNDRPKFGVPGESPIDRAIDRAVRDIMRVDPPAGLRRRVLARIEAPPRRSILFPRFTVAAAALAALVLTIVLLRPTAPQPAAPTRAASTAPASQPAAPPNSTGDPQPPAAAAPSQVATVTRPVPGPRSERIRMPRIGNVFGSASGAAAASLRDAPDAGITEPAGDSPADAGGALAPITVRPITIPGISVEPLRIPTIAPPK